MGSLLEGIETTPASGKAVKAEGKGSEAAKTVKLAVAIGGLVVGGGLIAWNAGLFGGSTPPAPPPQNAAANTPAAPAPVVPTVNRPKNMDAARQSTPAPTNQLGEIQTR